MLNQFLEKIDFSDLPEEPREAWLATYDKLNRYCAERLSSEFQHVKIDTLNSILDALRIAADELDVAIIVPARMPAIGGSFTDKERELRQVTVKLQNDITKEKLANVFRRAPQTQAPVAAPDDRLLISNQTLVAVHPKLQSLRNSVVQVEMDEAKRTQLLNLLNDFERELNTKEVSKSGSLKRMATIAAVIVGTANFLAVAPEAMETVGQITGYLGLEIEAADHAALIEKEQVALIEGPIKAPKE